MESSYNNYVYYIDYKGQEYATISWRSIWACDGYCLTEGSSSLSMRSTQENFIVTPHIQGGTFSYWSLYSKWYPHYYGVYDVIYSPRNKIVKKGNFNVSTTASEGGFVHYIYGSQEFLVSQQFTSSIITEAKTLFYIDKLMIITTILPYKDIAISETFSFPLSYDSLRTKSFVYEIPYYQYVKRIELGIHYYQLDDLIMIDINGNNLFSQGREWCEGQLESCIVNRTFYHTASINLTSPLLRMEVKLFNFGNQSILSNAYITLKVFYDQFTDNINTAINPQIGNSVNLLVRVDRVKQLYFDNLYPNGRCGIGGSKTFYFDFAALDYVKSISFVGTTDDYGFVVLNGTTIINQPYRTGESNWDEPVSKTIPTSLLKKKDNAITLTVYDGNIWGCSASGNGTAAWITLYFNYQFTDNINTAINPQIGNRVNILVRVDRVKQLYFENRYPSGRCDVGGSKTFYFDFVTLDYVKSISFTGTSDDYGSVALNGVTLINQPKNSNFSYWNSFVSGTIPVSYLKKNKNAITLSAYDGGLLGCYFGNNGTNTWITLYFNYQFTNSISYLHASSLNKTQEQNITLKNFITITFTGNLSNSTAGHYQEWLPWQKEVKNISTKYIKSVSVDYGGTFDDASVIRINNYRHFYQWIIRCGLDSGSGYKRITFNISDDNSLNLIKSSPNSIKLSIGAQDLCGGKAALMNVHFSITIYFEQFTDTINVNNSNVFNILETQKVFVGNSITYNFASYNSGIQFWQCYSSSVFYDFDFPFFNEDLDVKVTLYISGYVDDYLDVFLNNSKILNKHLGGWTLCQNWNNIYCSPILSPKTINLTSLNEHNTLTFRAVDINPNLCGQVWLKLDSVKIIISYKSK